jgi:rare lipoprotein A
MKLRQGILAGIALFIAARAEATETAPFTGGAASHQHFSEVGYASWYGSEFHGRPTADGEIFDMRGLSAAHRTMPIPSYARVTNLGNGRSIVVRVNDRGPFVRGRLVDVSARVAALLEFGHNGLVKVKLDYVGKAPPAGSDAAALLASLQTGKGPAAPARPVIAHGPNPLVTPVAFVGPELAYAPAPLAAPAAVAAIAFASSPAPRPLSESGESTVARIAEPPKQVKPRSPFGELVTYPFETAPLRLATTP